MTITASTPLRVVVLLTSVALALVLLLTSAVVARATDGSRDESVTPRIELEVTPGDTLWDIAAAYTEPGDDVRETIYEIKRANQLESSVIVVGEILVVPVDF